MRRQTGESEQTDRQTGRSRGDRGSLLALCRQTLPPPRPPLLPSLCLGCALGDPTTSHKRAHTNTSTRAYAHGRAHTRPCLALSLLSVLLFWEVALGITPSRGRVYVSPDFTLVRAHNTGRRTHLLSVCLQRRSGSPALRATFFPPIGGVFAPVTPFPRPLWISNNRACRAACWAACRGPARPGSTSVTAAACCHLGNAQPERRLKVREEASSIFSRKRACQRAFLRHDRPHSLCLDFLLGL